MPNLGSWAYRPFVRADVGDVAHDERDGAAWVCTVAGFPGTWERLAYPGWYVVLGGRLLAFAPLRGWRTWFRRGLAGGPLLGHVTPPIPS